MSFFESRYDNRIYLKSSLLDCDRNVCHGFTTKLGGTSHGRIEGFNLGFRVNDDKESVIENYRIMSDDMGIDISRMVLSKQTHTDNIRIVTEEDAGKGVARDSDIEDTDGLITDVSNLMLVIFSADCVPILMHDSKKGVIAAVHAGWRGSVKGIAPKCVRLMRENFGCDVEDIRVAIGPSIGPCCFEFGNEAFEYFGKKYCHRVSDNCLKVDLWEYNADLLNGLGVLPENIDISRICTFCESDKFYSYRKHKDKTGRMGAVIYKRSM